MCTDDGLPPMIVCMHAGMNFSGSTYVHMTSTCKCIVIYILQYIYIFIASTKIIHIPSGQSLIRYTHEQLPQKAFSLVGCSVLVEDRKRWAG